MRRQSLLGIALAVSALGGAQARAFGLTGVPEANPKVVGIAAPNVLTRELGEGIVAQGSTPLENGDLVHPFYGYFGDGPMVPAPGDVQTSTHQVEATKSEPDKNTYLVLRHVDGADPSYDYGHHFLYQGHELAAKDASGRPQGAITRINLDADGAHRVTLVATTDSAGNPLPTIDGSTWDPFAQRLLFTTESGSNASVLAATLDVPATVEDVSGALGRGGYEGIQNDSAGNLWIVEDVGGKAGAVDTHAKQPNSFVYRFVPRDPRDLAHGKLQALQVLSLANPGQPIAFHAGQADADILSQDVRDLHTYGKSFQTRWVTVHDTETDGTTPFDANALAKAASATPFKRPENGAFRPGSRFTEFFFDETGDTNAQTEAGSAFGGFGSILKLTQSRPSADTGVLTLLFLGDEVHTGLDNCAFWSADKIVFVEDAGDGLHTQRNAFDSAWVFDVRADYSKATTPPPLRLLALGRDASATLDSGYSAAGNGFQNEGDNEITGFHVSDGDPTVRGILGAKIPLPFLGWRVFYTQQHGDNATWELFPLLPGAFASDGF